LDTGQPDCQLHLCHRAWGWSFGFFYDFFPIQLKEIDGYCGNGCDDTGKLVRTGMILNPQKHYDGSSATFKVVLLMLVMMAMVILSFEDTFAQTQETTFHLRGFAIEGNTVLAEEELEQTLADFTGRSRTAEHVELAADWLETYYHKRGYPTIIISIPEQTVDDGIVRLEVIERKIRRVKITGNRFYTREKILDELPSLNPGVVIYAPRVQAEINRINLNRNMRLVPEFLPSRDIRTIDVELKVEDELPLHGSVELNNRASANTSDLRLNLSISYDNLWQKDHSIALQGQITPEDTEEVRLLAVSYTLPTPWDSDQMLAFYSIWSDSDTAFGDGFQVAGKGYILGGRWIAPLPPLETYYHSVTVGLDYKDFDETTAFTEIGQERLETPITYVPITFSYNSGLGDSWGRTTFSSGVTMGLRGLGSDREEFETKRFNASENFIYARLGVERYQPLGRYVDLFTKVDGQITDDALISNEQYLAGGMDSVRGYYESEQAGDSALHTTVEIRGPNLVELLLESENDRFVFKPHVFFDYAKLWVNDALPEQEDRIEMSGTGMGFRGLALGHLEYGLDWGIALSDTNQTDSGDHRVNFRLKYFF
jgi:hemolysin activation/secretion protein